MMTSRYGHELLGFLVTDESELLSGYSRARDDSSPRSRIGLLRRQNGVVFRW